MRTLTARASEARERRVELELELHLGLLLPLAKRKFREGTLAREGGLSPIGCPLCPRYPPCPVCARFIALGAKAKNNCPGFQLPGSIKNAWDSKTDRLLASSSSRRRRTWGWGTRNSVAGWMTPLMTLAFLTLGTPLIHEGRLGEGPAVAPRRYRWTVVRLTAGCSAFCYRL